MADLKSLPAISGATRVFVSLFFLLQGLYLLGPVAVKLKTGKKFINVPLLKNLMRTGFKV